MPFELITLVGGFILSAIIKLISLRMRMSQHKHEMLMDKVGLSNKATKQAREYKEPGFSFTRRTIALASVFAIIVAPIMAGIWSPYLPISYGYEETKAGFMFFTDATAGLSWVTGTGIILGPIHTHLIYAITGMYFGGSSVK